MPEPFDADKNKVLTDAQRRNYRAVFVKARDLLLDDMADGPDDAAVDAMRKHSSASVIIMIVMIEFSPSAKQVMPMMPTKF